MASAPAREDRPRAGGRGSGAAGEPAGRPREARPTQPSCAPRLRTAPLRSAPPGSVGRPPADVAAPPIALLLPRKAAARRPLARLHLRPGHAPAVPRPLPGARPGVRRRRCGRLLRGGGGLGPGQKRQGVRPLGRASRGSPCARHTPGPRLPPGAQGPRAWPAARLPAPSAAAPPPCKAPGEPRTASPALLEHGRWRKGAGAECK